MDATVSENPMAKTKGRPRKPSGEGTPVRIDSDVVSKAKLVAASFQDSPALSDYLSGLLRPLVEKEFRKLVEREARKADRGQLGE